MWQRQLPARTQNSNSRFSSNATHNNARHLWGPSARYLVGTQLAGAAIGVKGSVPSRFGAYSYDVFAGTPIYAPSGFPAPSVTLGFQVMAQF